MSSTEYSSEEFDSADESDHSAKSFSKSNASTTMKKSFKSRSPFKTTKLADTKKNRAASAQTRLVRELRNSLADKDRQIDSLKKENRTLQTIQKRHEKAINKFEGQEAETPSIIAKKDSEITALSKQCRSYRDRAHTSERECKKLNAQITDCKEKIAQLKQLVESKGLKDKELLETEVRKLQDELKSKDEVISKLEKLKTLYEKNTARLDRERRDGKSASAEVKALREQLQYYQAKLAEKERQLNDIINSKSSKSLPVPPANTTNQLQAHPPVEKRKSESKVRRALPEHPKAKSTEPKQSTPVPPVVANHESDQVSSEPEIEIETEHPPQMIKSEKTFIEPTRNYEEEERLKREKEDAERKRRQEDDERIAAEVLRREQERKQREKEETDRKLEEERKRQEEERKRQEEERRILEEINRKAEEEKRKIEEEEKRRQAEEERIKREQEEARLAIERAKEERKKKDALLAKLRALDEGKSSSENTPFMFADEPKKPEPVISSKPTEAAVPLWLQAESTKPAKYDPFKNMHDGLPARTDLFGSEKRSAKRSAGSGLREDIAPVKTSSSKQDNSLFSSDSQPKTSGLPWESLSSKTSFSNTAANSKLFGGNSNSNSNTSTVTTQITSINPQSNSRRPAVGNPILKSAKVIDDDDDGLESITI